MPASRRSKQLGQAEGWAEPAVSQVTRSAGHRFGGNSGCSLARPDMAGPPKDDTIAWARLWPGTKPVAGPTLRAGAWYPVVADDGETRVELLVARERVTVQRRMLEVRKQRPARFTVVSRMAGDPNPARGTAADLGPVYAVCPGCMGRVALSGAPPATTCPKCGHRGEVAWWEGG